MTCSMCCRCGDVLFAIRQWKVWDVCWTLWRVCLLEAQEVPEVPEAIALCATLYARGLEVLEGCVGCYAVFRRLWRIGSFCERWWRWWRCMRSVPLCMLEAVKGGLCPLDVLEVMRRVLLCMMEAVEGELFSGGGGGDALRAGLYTGGCGRWALFVGGGEMLEVVELRHRVLLCMLEAAEGALLARRRGDVEVWRSGALEACCGCRDM